MKPSNRTKREFHSPDLLIFLIFLLIFFKYLFKFSVQVEYMTILVEDWRRRLEEWQESSLKRVGGVADDIGAIHLKAGGGGV